MSGPLQPKPGASLHEPGVFSLAIRGAGAAAAEDLWGALAVTGFVGVEGISKLFKFDVDVLAPPGIDLTAEPGFLGRRAAFGFGAHAPEAGTVHRARVVHGVVGRVTALGVATAYGELSFRVRVVPPLWFAKRRIASRVFQDATVPEVVEALLARPGGTVQKSELRLTSTYPKRDYCVQYRESDYAFLKRILAEEGIYWYFRHSDDPEQAHEDALVLADAAAAYEAPGSAVPSLRLSARALDHGAAAHRDVSRFTLAREVRSDQVELKDYDFQRPRLDLRAHSSDEPRPGDVRASVAGLRVYEHRGDYLGPEVTSARAGRRLEQERRRAQIGEGESTAPSLLPGHRFRFEADEVQGLAGDYAVTRVRHEGHVPGHEADRDRRVYQNAFSCVRADVAFRPSPPEPVARQVLESAVVVGPEEGTVYTDTFGRVRVQFHWDLDGSFDEHSTTWLRVVQGWAGPSFGWQFIPRVGMEVMVSFLGGDPDCPVVLGAIHNGVNPHPFRVPDEATRSGLRTQSWPGGGGFNELSFDDATGAEQIYLHAQNDLDEEVRRDRTTKIGKSAIVTVGDDQKTRVGRDREEIVAGRASRAVGGDEIVEVKGTRAAAVAGHDRTSVEGERSVQVGGGERTEVQGEASWTVHDDLTVRADGSHTTIVGKPDAKRAWVLHVEGTTDLYGTGKTAIASKEGIRLSCGDSVIDVSPSRVEIVSPSIVLRSTSQGARIGVEDDTIQLFSKTDASVKSAHVVLATKDGAAVGLRKQVTASGQKILLNSPDQASDPPEEQPTPPTVIKLVDANGQPLAGSPIVIELPDGSERSFMLDGEGSVEIPDLEGSPRIRFPGLTGAQQG